MIHITYKVCVNSFVIAKASSQQQYSTSEALGESKVIQ